MTSKINEHGDITEPDLPNRPNAGQEKLLADTGVVVIPSDGISVIRYGGEYHHMLVDIEHFNWKAPVNYAEGVIHVYLEFLSKPTDKLALCYPILEEPGYLGHHWWAGSNAHPSWGYARVTGPYVHQMVLPMKESWLIDKETLTLENPPPLNVLVIFKYEPGRAENNIPFDDQDYFPMTLRLIWVVVAKGGTFSGWQNYVQPYSGDIREGESEREGPSVSHFGEELLARDSSAVERREADRKAAKEKSLREAETDRKLGDETEPARKMRIRGDRMTVSLADDVEMEFVRVRAGEFLMGRDKRIAFSDFVDTFCDELPQHRVYLDEYWMAKYPVTNAQYRAFLTATGAKKPPHWKNGHIPTGKKSHPVVCVSWYDAVVFCEWASRVTGVDIRLPTEAEREKGARGMDGRIFPWGDAEPNPNRCNFSDAGLGDTTPVGQYSPDGDSPYGCADMAGNVWEWVADRYHWKYYKDSPRENPRGPALGERRVLRGGAFRSNGQRAMRCASRNYNLPLNFDEGSGFRVVADLNGSLL